MSSKSFTVTNFAYEIINKFNIKGATKLIIYLDSKIYPNEFGISVRPLQVRSGNTTIDMKQLIDTFDKIPYITVKETRYRSVYRDPMIMTIDLTPKQFQDNTYYDYFIDKLCLRSELKRYLSIEQKSHDVIKEFRQSQNSVAALRNQFDEANDSIELN